MSPPVGGWPHWHRRALRSQQGYLAWRNWPSICHRRLPPPPFVFPHCPLYHSPLVKYFISLSFCRYSFSFLSLRASFTYSPFSGNGLAPRSTHIAAAPIYSCPGRPLIGAAADGYRRRKGRNETAHDLFTTVNDDRVLLRLGQSRRSGLGLSERLERAERTERETTKREILEKEKGTRITLCTI